MRECALDALGETRRTSPKTELIEASSSLNEATEFSTQAAAIRRRVTLNERREADEAFARRGDRRVARPVARRDVWLAALEETRVKAVGQSSAVWKECLARSWTSLKWTRGANDA